MSQPRRSAEHKVEEARQARDALATALSRAGIQLPAMDVHTPGYEVVDDDAGTPDGRSGRNDAGTGRDGNGDDVGRPARYALVHLGVCSAPVALALAEVIEKGAAG
jgi:hypothetical protein